MYAYFLSSDTLKTEERIPRSREFCMIPFSFKVRVGWWSTVHGTTHKTGDYFSYGTQVFQPL